MFKPKFSCSAIGNQVNEDYVAVGSTYAVLLDGASGITDTRVLPHILVRTLGGSVILLAAAYVSI